MEKDVNLSQYGQYTERRQHPRDPCFIAADFAIQDKVFSDFVRNISPGGVYIETKAPVLNGTEITVVFSLPSCGEPLKTAGNIVWNSLQGLGVRFHTVRPMARLRRWDRIRTWWAYYWKEVILLSIVGLMAATVTLLLLCYFFPT